MNFAKRSTHIAVALALTAGVAHAQISGNVVKIGVLPTGIVETTSRDRRSKRDTVSVPWPKPRSAAWRDSPPTVSMSSPTVSSSCSCRALR